MAADDLGVVTYADVLGARAVAAMSRRAGLDVPEDIARMASMDEHTAPLAEELAREERLAAADQREVPVYDVRDTPARGGAVAQPRAFPHGVLTFPEGETRRANAVSTGAAQRRMQKKARVRARRDTDGPTS